MKTFFRWAFYAVLLVLPLILLQFVGYLSNVMHWEIGSPAMPGYNWFRWSHAYAIFGSLICFALYIPTIIAILKKSLKPLAITAVLMALLIVVSVVLAIVGKNTYHEQQVKYAEKVFAANPNDSITLERLATAYSQNGEYAKAIDNFNKALVITANPAYVIHDRGLAYVENGQYELAIADFTKAMELRGDEKYFVKQCYNDRGLAYFKSGKFKQSSEDVNNALEMGYDVHPVFRAALREKGFEVSQ